MKQGATTIWERWDGQKPDGTFQDAGMNSFNHYAYGAIGEWMYRVVAGLELDPAEPGYKHVLVQPQPGGGLTSAEARLQTLYGETVSGWSLADGKVTVTATVPPNAHGTVRLPAATLADVTEGGLAVARAPGVKAAAQDGGRRGGRGRLGKLSVRLRRRRSRGPDRARRRGSVRRRWSRTCWPARGRARCWTAGCRGSRPTRASSRRSR